MGLFSFRSLCGTDSYCSDVVESMSDSYRADAEALSERVCDVLDNTATNAGTCSPCLEFVKILTVRYCDQVLPPRDPSLLRGYAKSWPRHRTSSYVLGVVRRLLKVWN